jgi:hypothetical protein
MASMNPFGILIVAVLSIGLGLPFWIPVVFLAYALGRRQYTVNLFFLALIAEAVALTIAGQLWLSWFAIDK